MANSTTKKPVSEKQLAANRANALKSTGPKSEAGKRRAASNSLKHGLYSDNLLSLFNEDRNFHCNLLENLRAEYQPVSPTEHLLVQQLAHLQVRFMRAQKFYLELLNERAELMAPDVDAKFEDSIDMNFRYALAYKQEVETGRAFESLLRELDRLPFKIRKTIEALVWYREQSRSEKQQELTAEAEKENIENEAISDLDPLPTLCQLHGFYPDKPAPTP